MRTSLVAGVEPLAAAMLASMALLSVSGCGSASGDRTLKGGDVSAAFARAGVPLTRWGGMNGIDEYMDAPFRPGGGRLDVQVFPSVKLARYAQKIGGNLEDASGNRVRPLAVVSNVVVTVYPDAPRKLRASSRRAVAILRSTAAG